MRNVGCVQDTLEQGERSVDVECDRDGVVWIGVVDDLDMVLDILERNVKEMLVEIEEASKQENFVEAWGATLPVRILVYDNIKGSGEELTCARFQSSCGTAPQQEEENRCECRHQQTSLATRKQPNQLHPCRC